MVAQKLKVKLLDLETGQKTIALHESDAQELGLLPGDRVKLAVPKLSLIAIVQITSRMVKPGEIGASIKVTEDLQLKPGDMVNVSPAPIPKSVEFIKKKMDGQKLSENEIQTIIDDIVGGNLSSEELTSFVVAEYIRDMDMDEIVALTKSMVDSGDRLKLDISPVFDVHSIGGVPGNKYALVTVPIVAAAGLVVPKTSSRAITSAAGTADVMEVLADVSFGLDEIKEIVEKVGAVLAWGGAVKLAPADDIIVNIERMFSIDPRCQLLASVMSKKLAVNADHILIDIPTGPTAKIETMECARALAHDFMALGHELGVQVEAAITYGGQPVGYTIGPSLEAREALETLLGNGPGSLIEKSTSLAGVMLELGGVAPVGAGKEMAREILNSGKAYRKMREIIEAQGGNPDVKPEDIEIGDKKEVVVAPHDGYITSIDNRRLVEIARAAGAPRDREAGIKIILKKGHKVNKGEPLFEIYSKHESKLSEALALAGSKPPIRIEGMLLERLISGPRMG
jgi:AMP phosphorylase